MQRFSEPVRAWFETSFAAPTAAQDARAGRRSPAGDHTLILAPTGSGKTLAAFLWAIDRLATTPEPPKAERCRVLYISPLRALAVDVEKNLRAPLAGIALAAERLGAPLRAADRRDAHRRHARQGTAGARPHAARHPHHDARVALPDAHVARTGDRCGRSST